MTRGEMTKPGRQGTRQAPTVVRSTLATSAVSARPFGILSLPFLATGAFMFLAAIANLAHAVGGTAVPPAPGLGFPSQFQLPAPFIDAPTFTTDPAAIKGFKLVGFLQNATVSGEGCPSGTPAAQYGGTVVVNDTLVTIPCNTTLQMPAATFKWAELFDPSKFKTTATPPVPLALDKGAAQLSGNIFSFASIEVTVYGNIVAGHYIAGLLFLSQQSLNSSSGYITGFDYPKGVIFIAKTPGGASVARLQLNDINGRFSAGQSPDTRFNADDANPTIRSATGYPMCVPRFSPTDRVDPRCPQRNRPLVAAGCRNFAAAGISLPTGREMAPPKAGQVYCSNFVMGDPATARPNEPTSTEQAPFEIGDYITYAGTVLVGDGKGPGASDTISVHTIVASVGIYTQPGTLPVYIALGDFSVGADAPLVFNFVPQEAQDRLVLDAFVTDVTSIVDVYLVDLDPETGQETQRWVTPQSMTGGLGAFGTNDLFIDGGITTQFTGPVPGRVRIRANKAFAGILASPTRYMRVATRSLCDPVDINAQAPLLGSNPEQYVPCLQRAPAANGLFSGQYLAPVFNFIFPENLTPGDPTVPANFWALGFLVKGEGPGTGPLSPTPW